MKLHRKEEKNFIKKDNNNGTKPHKQEVLGYNGSIQAGIYRFYG